MRLEVNAGCGSCSALPPKCPDFCVLQRDWIENRFQRSRWRRRHGNNFDIFCYDSTPPTFAAPICTVVTSTRTNVLSRFIQKMDGVVDGNDELQKMTEMTRLQTIHLQNISNFHGALWLTLLATEGPKKESGCSTKIFVDVDVHCMTA